MFDRIVLEMYVIDADQNYNTFPKRLVLAEPKQGTNAPLKLVKMVDTTFF